MTCGGISVDSNVDHWRLGVPSKVSKWFIHSLWRNQFTVAKQANVWIFTLSATKYTLKRSLSQLQCFLRLRIACKSLQNIRLFFLLFGYFGNFKRLDIFEVAKVAYFVHNALKLRLDECFKKKCFTEWNLLVNLVYYVYANANCHPVKTSLRRKLPSSLIKTRTMPSHAMITAIVKS